MHPEIIQTEDQQHFFTLHLTLVTMAPVKRGTNVLMFMALVMAMVFFSPCAARSNVCLFQALYSSLECSISLSPCLCILHHLFHCAVQRALCRPDPDCVNDGCPIKCNPPNEPFCRYSGQMYCCCGDPQSSRQMVNNSSHFLKHNNSSHK